MIGLAKVHGADYVKFQLYDHNKIYKDHPEIPDSSLTKEQAKELFDYGEQLGIEVFFSVFDLERVQWCEEIGVRTYKIAYSQKDNMELREAVEKTGKLCFISGVNLYCVPEYPAEEVDFTNLDDYSGFSDHTIGMEAAEVAIELGAEFIEKHFAINHDKGVDAPWSMTPKELRGLKKFENATRRSMGL